MHAFLRMHPVYFHLGARCLFDRRYSTAADDYGKDSGPGVP